MTAVKELEDQKVVQAQKEILEELYRIRESLSKELGGLKPAAHVESAAGSAVDHSTLEQLYKLRDSLSQELQKTTEKFETSTSKMSFRIDHLKANLLAALEVLSSDSRRTRD